MTGTAFAILAMFVSDARYHYSCKRNAPGSHILQDVFSRLCHMYFRTFHILATLVARENTPGGHFGEESENATLDATVCFECPVGQIVSRHMQTYYPVLFH